MIDNKIIPFEKDIEKRKEAMERIKIRQQVYGVLNTTILDIVPYNTTKKNVIYLNLTYQDKRVRVALTERVLYLLTYINNEKVLLNVIRETSLSLDKEAYILVESFESAERILAQIKEHLYLYFAFGATYDDFMNSLISSSEFL